MVRARHLDDRRTAFLLGIEGVGMSAAAELLLARGVTVSGADQAPGERTGRLEGLGLLIQDEGRALPEGLDLVVASAAIPANHPRLEEAERRGIETWKYAELLGALMHDRYAISIAGCHGKTTTTSLAASCLLSVGLDPTFVIGGALRCVGTGARSGRGRHFVAEACEFDRSFHHHAPQVAVVLNVEADHLDYYADLAEIEEAYRVFAARTAPDGMVLVHESCADVFRGDPRIRARLETYGAGEDATWRVVPEDDTGGFQLVRRGVAVGSFEVPLLGPHNALNGAAAAIALLTSGVPAADVQAGLRAFEGVGRRLEPVLEKDDLLLLDDYGHHPTEIAATLGALRGRHAGRRLVLIFQPHQASRTLALLDDLAAALAPADAVWLPPIYFARDSAESRARVSSADLAECVRRHGGTASAFETLDAVVEHGHRAIRPGDVVVTMGAGNVDEVARALADRLR